MAKHVHKYEKTSFGKKEYKVFKCMLPDCPHYLQPALTVGRKHLCWGCGDEMIIEKRHLSVNKPKCAKCVELRRRTLQEMKELPTEEELIEMGEDISVNFGELITK